MNDMDWSTPEYLATITADELSGALDRHGIRYHTVFGDTDGTVSVSFEELRDAELMMAFTFNVGVPVPGSLYDRATGGCVALSAMSKEGAIVADEEISSVMRSGWNWMIHPHMSGRRMGWHASVDFSTADANAVTIALNTVPQGGAA